jgi:hypothetical protein
MDKTNLLFTSIEEVKPSDEQKNIELIAKTGYTHDQLKEIFNAIEKQNKTYTKEYKISRNHVKIGVSGDYHLGNMLFDDGLFNLYLKETKKEKVNIHLNTGDIFDGWYQNRPSSIFEQNAVGFDNQMKIAIEKFSKLDAPLYFITGNHSYNTFVRGAGVEAGIYLEDKLNQLGHEAHFLGNAEGDVVFNNSKIKLLHPDGGSSYALSYRPQKIIESLSGGEKPEVLLIGHFHKIEQLFYRNVHTFQTGTLCGQTKFMRGKNIPAHKAFWILDIYSNKNGGVDKIKTQLYTAYD